MKRINNLFEKFVSFENLLLGYEKSKKGTKTEESYFFSFTLEKQIFKLQKSLIENTYEPDDYKYFIIKDPKEREISVASFKDRVVHHALINILEPIYEKSFIFNSYATRKEKGTHKAIEQAQKYIRKNEWYFKSDISKYFNSINHSILIKIIEKKIKDKKLLLIIEKIVKKGGDGKNGIPIGNLTSQFFANVYLDQLDHYLKDFLGIEYYIRYMDDFVVFSYDKDILNELKAFIEIFLKNELNLLLKDRATYVNKTSKGLNFLGTIIYGNLIRIKKQSFKRIMKKYKQNLYLFENNLLSEEKYLATNSSIFSGNLSKIDTLSLRKSIIEKGQL